MALPQLVQEAALALAQAQTMRLSELHLRRRSQRAKRKTQGAQVHQPSREMIEGQLTPRHFEALYPGSIHILGLLGSRMPGLHLLPQFCPQANNAANDFSANARLHATKLPMTSGLEVVVRATSHCFVTHLANVVPTSSALPKLVVEDSRGLVLADVSVPKTPSRPRASSTTQCFASRWKSLRPMRPSP